MSDKPQFHPLADKFDWMSKTEADSLVESIKDVGQLVPIQRYRGKILDGRHRYMACQKAGIKPVINDLPDDVDPLKIVKALNLRRRQLTESQLAIIASRLAQPDGNPPTGGTTVEKAAGAVGVSTRSVERANRVRRTASREQVKDVEEGRASLREVESKTKPKEKLDHTGYPIPEKVQEDWERALETGKRLAARCSDLKCEVDNGLTESDVIFAEVNNGTVADLLNAFRVLNLIKPYAVCPKCQGRNRKDCTCCKARGFVSEFFWEQKVSTRDKELRAKAVKGTP